MLFRNCSSASPAATFGHRDQEALHQQPERLRVAGVALQALDQVRDGAFFLLQRFLALREDEQLRGAQPRVGLQLCAGLGLLGDDSFARRELFVQVERLGGEDQVVVVRVEQVVRLE